MIAEYLPVNTPARDRQAVQKQMLHWLDNQPMATDAHARNAALTYLRDVRRRRVRKSIEKASRRRTGRAQRTSGW